MLSKTALIWSAIALVFGVVAYTILSSAISKSQNSSKKAEQVKMLQEEYKRREFGTSVTKSDGVQPTTSSPDSMTISKLYIYPIKSLRGCEVSSALLTKEGFYLDRRFMLLKDHEQTPPKLQNMHVPHFPTMCLFHTSIDPSTNTLIVSYLPPGSSSSSPKPEDQLSIPLEPSSFTGLESIPVEMHKSPTTAVNMGEKYNAWFSARFGFSVILAFWAGNPRPVLGNLPNKTYPHPSSPPNPITKLLTSLPPIIKNILQPLEENENNKIAFNDCAPYLIISETSVDEVSTRLPPNTTMDLTKFRANLVVRGAKEAYAEDYWSELSFSSTSTSSPSNPPKILLTANCGRCASLNVDYTTGAAGTGPDGQVLKLLQRDRRVDRGTKYSPIFGRYGFITLESEGTVLKVGDEVALTGKNKEGTRFYWPGLST